MLGKNYKALSSLLKVSLLSFIAIFAFAIYDFVLPIFTEDQAGSLALVGIIVSLVYVASLIAEVPVGRLVDRYGRIRVLMIATTSLAALGIIYFALNDILWLASLSLIVGVLAVAFWIPSAVLVRQFSPKNMLNASQGIYLTITQLGWIGGPILAGFIAETLSPKHNFLIFAGFMFAATIAALILFKGKDTTAAHLEPHKHRAKINAFLESFTKFVKLHKHATPLYILTMIANIWIALEWSFIAIAGMQVFHLTDGAAGLLVGAMMAMEGLLYFTSGYLMDKIGSKYVLTAGFFLLFCATYFTFLSHTMEYYVISVLLAAGATSWIIPGTEALLTKITPANILGEMTSVFDTSKDFGLIIGPLAGGFIASFFGSAQYAFSLVFITAAVATILCGYVFWPEQKDIKINKLFAKN
ncbi:MAG: MFS transporter [Nanoarchaeota archaeon]